MEMSPGPPGYPGDEAIQTAMGRTLRALRLERGWTEEQVEAELKKQSRANRHEFLTKAVAITLRRI